VRLCLEAEQALDGGARGRDAYPPVPRRDLDTGEQIGMAFGESTGGGEAACSCQQQDDALFARRRLR
jgi:hypothetical protein